MSRVIFDKRIRLYNAGMPGMVTWKCRILYAAMKRFVAAEQGREIRTIGEENPAESELSPATE